MKSMILKEPITGPAAWRGRELAGDESWIRELSDDAIASLDRAITQVKGRGLAFPFFGPDDFSIPELAQELHAIAEELENGRGFLLLRGLPVNRYTDEEIKIAYYGIGLNLGQPVTQNPKGDLLGVVANVGDLNDRQTRVYETNAYLPYHTDPSDVVGLLCLRKAKTGGVSSLVSAAAVYNEFLNKHPEFLALLYNPFFYAHLGDDKLSPLFSFNEGKLSCRYLRQYIELGHDMHKHPLSRVEMQALDLFDATMQNPEIRIDMMLEPGDIQFVNNYAVMHSRSQFEDFDEPERRRKKLRLWLKMSNARSLAPDFPGRNGFGIPTRQP